MTLHVAIVNRHPADAVGGSELQCDLFARGLVARGHAVTYVALHSHRHPTPSEAVPYRIVPLKGHAAPSAATIVQAVRDAGADVVYWRYGRERLDGVVAGLGRSPRIPLVLAVAHVDDVLRWPSGPLARPGPRTLAADLRRRLRHRASWRAFRGITAIAAQREDFVGRTPVALQRHVPNVVDPSLAPIAWPRPYVAWVANLKARKRPEEIVPLAQALAAHDVDLLVAGSVQDERYRSLTMPDPALPNLHMLGALAPAEAAGLIAGARCLAVTARPEGLSNAMIQAWWHGVPTVSLDYDPDDAIAAHGLGAVCGGDVQAFRTEVVRFAIVDDARAASGARAHAYARARFDLDRNVALLDDLLVAAVRAAGLRRS